MGWSIVRPSSVDRRGTRALRDTQGSKWIKHLNRDVHTSWHYPQCNILGRFVFLNVTHPK